jgi:hypothetical protein
MHRIGNKFCLGRSTMGVITTLLIDEKPTKVFVTHVKTKKHVLKKVPGTGKPGIQPGFSVNEELLKSLKKEGVHFILIPHSDEDTKSFNVYICETNNFLKGYDVDYGDKQLALTLEDIQKHRVKIDYETIEKILKEENPVIPSNVDVIVLKEPKDVEKLEKKMRSIFGD